jgi:hypothetical protein
MQVQIRAVDARVVHRKCVSEIRLWDGQRAYKARGVWSMS